VNDSVKAGATDAEAFAAKRAEISAIEGESLKATGFRSDVVTLYQGGMYNLYRYKKYTDVRLVFVPEFQAAFFGGDPDNFNFPRFNIDMALVRVYENDKPVQSASYFKWSSKGTKEGDLFLAQAIQLTSFEYCSPRNFATPVFQSLFVCLRDAKRVKKYMALAKNKLHNHRMN
jgi:hypothetical protein